MAYSVDILDSAGAKVAQLDQAECECIVYRHINSEWKCTLKYIIPQDTAVDKTSYLTAWGARIKILNLYDSTSQTFKVSRTNRSVDTNGVPICIAEGEHLAIARLNEEVINDNIALINVTVTQALTRILTFSSYYTCGTIGPTDKVNITISWETVLSALQKILDAVGAEFDVDEVNSEIDISKTLGANNYLNVRNDKNLRSLSVNQYSRDVVNKLYGIGGGTPPATIAGARQVVYSISTTLLTCDTNKVVAEDDSWNTYKVKFVTGAEAGNSFVINDCAHGTARDTLTLASAPSCAAGDKFIITTSGGIEVDFIRAGTSITTYGEIEGVYRNGLYTDAINYVLTPALDGTYTAGLCQDWTKLGSPTVSENTTQAQIMYGAKSQKIIGASDGDGISQTVVVTANKYYRCVGWVYISAGTVKFQVSDGTNTFDLSKSSTGWQRFDIVEKMTGNVTAKFMQSGATAATFYVDSVMITEGVIERSFSANSSMGELWGLAFDALMKAKDPLVEYQCKFIDLNKIDPGSYPYDAVVIGDTVTINDSVLGISNVTARVKEISCSVFEPEKTEHTISNI